MAFISCSRPNTPPRLGGAPCSWKLPPLLFRHISHYRRLPPVARARRAADTSHASCGIWAEAIRGGGGDSAGGGGATPRQRKPQSDHRGRPHSAPQGPHPPSTLPVTPCSPQPCRTAWASAPARRRSPSLLLLTPPASPCSACTWPCSITSGKFPTPLSCSGPCFASH